MMKKAILLTVPLFVSLAYADVTIETITKSGGFQGFGAQETKSKQQISGLKSRNESKTKFKSRMMNMMGGGGGENVVITRVDRGEYIKENKKRKSFTVTPIQPLSQMTNPWKEMQKEQKAVKKGKGGPADKPTHRVKKSSFDVKKTGKKIKKNGFDTYEVLTTASISVEEIATKLVSTYRLESKSLLANWNGKLKKAHEEQMAFSKALMAKLGIKIFDEDRKKYGADQMAMMLGLSGGASQNIIKKMVKKAKAYDGFTVVNDTKWYFEEDPKVTAAKEKAHQDAAAEDDESELNMSGGVKGLAGSFLGGFAKKKMKASADKKRKAKAGKPTLDTYYEVKAIKFDKIPDRQFEATKGFKKIEQEPFQMPKIPQQGVRK